MKKLRPSGMKRKAVGVLLTGFHLFLEPRSCGLGLRCPAQPRGGNRKIDYKIWKDTYLVNSWHQ